MIGPDGPGALDAYVERAQALLDLRIDPPSRAAVVEHFSRLLEAAALLTDFLLPEGAEPASVFRP